MDLHTPLDIFMWNSHFSGEDIKCTSYLLSQIDVHWIYPCVHAMNNAHVYFVGVYTIWTTSPGPSSMWTSHGCRKYIHGHLGHVVGIKQISNGHLVLLGILQGSNSVPLNLHSITNFPRLWIISPF